jgi:ABC-2 type transport system ATP-binding protein
VVWQGAIEAIRGGVGSTLLVEVDDVPAARALLADYTVEDTAAGLRVSLPTDADPHVAAEINRTLVAAGIGVRRLDPFRASLEQRFLEITSRLEEAA